MLDQVDSTFSWLHFTDLHQGMWSQDWLWPNFREVLFEDLRRLRKVCRPWDLVMFTGDLTQQGSDAEFEQLDGNLAKLWQVFAELGCNPALVAVPGNHDLVRPDRLGPEHELIKKWGSDPATFSAFWEQPDSRYETAIDEMFAPFERWWVKRRGGLPRSWSFRSGRMPGDWSLVIPHHGHRIGVVGLNSSYVQLDGGDYRGRLHVDVRQFHGACGRDGPGWANGQDINFLMTHHGTTWLGEKAANGLSGEINVPGRFLAHLYGHMHESEQTITSEGGAKPRRAWQAASLFGLETFAEKVSRAHGYVAGEVRFDTTSAHLRHWPRSAKRIQGNTLALGNDRLFQCEMDGGTPVEVVQLMPLRVPPLQLRVPLVGVGAPQVGETSAEVKDENGLDVGEAIRTEELETWCESRREKASTLLSRVDWLAILLAAGGEEVLQVSEVPSSEFVGLLELLTPVAFSEVFLTGMCLIPVGHPEARERSQVVLDLYDLLLPVVVFLADGDYVMRGRHSVVPAISPETMELRVSVLLRRDSLWEERGNVRVPARYVNMKVSMGVEGGVDRQEFEELIAADTVARNRDYASQELAMARRKWGAMGMHQDSSVRRRDHIDRLSYQLNYWIKMQDNQLYGICDDVGDDLVFFDRVAEGLPWLEVFVVPPGVERGTENKLAEVAAMIYRAYRLRQLGGAP